MITAILNGAEIPVFGFDFKHSELKIPEFNLKVSAADIADPSTLVFADIEIYDDGNLLASGIINALPLPDIEGDSITLYKLSCDTDLGRLFLEMAADFQFQNISVSAAVNTLLAEAQDSTWSINSSATLTAENITIDVRDKESLWAQIKYILDSASEPTFLRYVGFSGGSHLIDIGSFGSNVRTHDIITGVNVIGTPRFRQVSQLPIKEIRPISGKVGFKPVNLSEALLLDPSLTSHPDYPMQSTTQSVLNNTVTVGRRLRKRYTEHKTSNNVPATGIQRAQVALALYRTAVREIKGATPYEELEVEVFLESPPPLYDNVYVDLSQKMLAYDPLTETETLVDGISIRGFLRVKGYRIQDTHPYSADDLQGLQTEGRLYKVALTSGFEIEDYNESELVMNKIKTDDLEDNGGIIVDVLGETYVVVNHASVAADCNYDGNPNTGKRFEFPLGSIPPGATAVVADVVASDPDTVDTSVVIQAATLANNLILCVSGPGGANWTTSDDVTVTVRYTFT